MKKKYYKMITAIVIMFICIYVIALNGDKFNETVNIYSENKSLTQNFNDLLDYSVNNKAALDDIFYVTSDANNNYIIKDKARKIIKTDNEDRITQTIVSEDLTGKSFFSYLTPDGKGNLYVVKTTLSDNGIYVDQEEIVRYNSLGKVDKTIYSVTYKSGEKNMRIGRIKRIEIKNSLLYFYSITDASIEVKTIDLGDASKVNSIFTISAPAGMHIYNAAPVGDDAMAVLFRNGDIYTIDNKNATQIIFSNKGNEGTKKFLPFVINTLNNQIFVMDYYSDGLIKFNSLFSNSNQISDTNNAIKNMTNPNYKTYFSAKYNDLKNFFITNDGKIIAYNYNQVFFINSEGNINKVMTYTKRFDYQIRNLWLYWLLCFFTLILMIDIIRLIYVEFMERKLSLIVKEILVFAPIFLVIVIFLGYRIQVRSDEQYNHQMQERLQSIAQIGAKFIDGDALDRLNTPQNYMNKDYIDTTEKIRGEFTASQTDTKGTFNVIFKFKDDSAYFILDDDTSTSFFRPADLSAGNGKILYNELVNQRKIVFAESSDSYGEWVNVKVPVKNSNDRVVGVYEVGINYKSFKLEKDDFLRKNLIDIGVVGIISLLAFIIITVYFLKSIKILKKGVEEISSGNLDIVLAVNSSDEISDLCKGFNKMAQRIRTFITQITTMNSAYYYFVPEEFLHIMGKESIQDIKLGDNIKKEMGQIYSKLRTVQILSKNTDENFKFINSYLKKFGPIIRNNHGVIEKYLGVDISAIFPKNPEDAINSAIEMGKKLAKYNENRVSRNEQQIDIGIGIYHDYLMVGIIGEEKRVEGTVISDNGDICKYLANLTEELNSRILATENTIKMLKNPEEFKLRDVGDVYLKIHNKNIKIYDIYQSDDDIIISLKDKTKILFERGINFYRNKQFYEGRESFAEVIRQNKMDEAAKMYFYLCDECYRNGISMEWNCALNWEE